MSSCQIHYRNFEFHRLRMRVAGIIAEYNPMHNGHIYHLQKTREISKADFVIAVMSGHFTQRGEPAIIDKWERSRIAVLNGADLVLELPFIYATGSAPDFAYGGVEILEGLGIVDAVSFGSESADIDKLEQMACFLNNESTAFKQNLKKHLDRGLSFPAARQIAVEECLGKDSGRLLMTPNDILAVEYLKHVRTMTPVAIKRQGSYSSAKLPSEMDINSALEAEHTGCVEMLGNTDATAAVSAKAVRKALTEGKFDQIRPFVPDDSYEALCAVYGPGVISTLKRKYYDLLRMMILSYEKEELRQIRGMDEGMENRIKKEIRMNADYESFADALKSKRYTRTKIDRLLLHILAGLKKSDCASSNMIGQNDKSSSKHMTNSKSGNLYTRVLAFNEKGALLLKKAADVSTIPVITNINKNAGSPEIAKYDIMAADLYNLLFGRDMYKYSDYVKRPFHVII